MRTILAAAALSFAMVGAVSAQTVKVTSLGSHDGELCRRDRAILFEDPNGTTVLFDIGRTVAGPGDPRLGKVDVVLLSSVHGDHAGDSRMPKVGAGSCAKPDTSVKAAPNSNTAIVAAKKGAKLIAGGHMRAFMRTRVVAAGGKKKQVLILRFGGKRVVNGVKIATIPTVHANGASSKFLDKELSGAFKANGLTAYTGPDSGFIITFTNGLVVYLSADTGHTSDMETLVRRYYKANLAIMNIGDVFTMGPEEAAWAVNELIKPKATIPTHANEVSTKGGKVIAGTRVDKYRSLVKGIPVHIPLSGRTMAFDGNARCVQGCG